MDKTRKCKMVFTLFFLLSNLSIALFCGYYVIKCLLESKEPLTTNPPLQHDSSENDNLNAKIENESNSDDIENRSRAAEVQTYNQINDTEKWNASVVKQNKDTSQITDQDIILLKDRIKPYEEFEERCQILFNYCVSNSITRNYAISFIDTNFEAKRLLELAISADPNVIEAVKAHRDYLKSKEDKPNSQENIDLAAKRLTSNNIAESRSSSKDTIYGILRVRLPLG